MSKNLVFIVAYNHEQKIEKVVARIPAGILADANNEVLIIDDGSRDRTFYESDGLRQKIQSQARLTVLRNPVNQGYGGNQKLGYRYAIDHGFDRVFLIHGDGQYAPELLEDFIREYKKQPAPDAVFGTRMASWKSPLKGGMPFYKFVGNKILTTLQNVLLKSSLSEFHSGYRSYSTELLKKIPFEVNSNDFHFDTEIIIQCLAVKAVITELPIPTHYGDEVCHVNGLAYAKNVMLASLRYRIQQLGFLYDRKFDVVQSNEYPRKDSPYSSHRKLADQIPAFSRVLDLGCGRGNVAKFLIQKGCIVDGVDCLPQEELQAPFRNYFKLDLVHHLEGLTEILKNNEYDVILLADIIEHLMEPEKILDLIRAHHRLHPRPTIVASTGNVAFLIVRTMLALGQFNYGPRGILDRTHTRLFTKKSFRHIFEQAGFQVKKEFGICMPVTAVLGDKSALGHTLESIHNWIVGWWPTMAAYQIAICAEPLPTTNQLLEVCETHSQELRSHYIAATKSSEKKLELV